MSKRSASWLTLGLLAIVVGVTRGDHQRDWSCLVPLADQLQDHARGLSCEFERSYRWTPQYWDLQSNTQRISMSAGQLKRLARAGGDVQALKCELDYIADAMSNLSQLGCGTVATVGSARHHTAWRYEPAPCRSEQVLRLMECMEKTVCQANDEIAKLRGPVSLPVSRSRHDHMHGRPVYRGPATYAYGPTRNYHGNNPGVSISNGRVSFYFGR